MPPRFTFWTIIIDGQPTAFRAAERDELAPALKQLQAKNPTAVLKWFARGRVWESPEDARRARAEAEAAAREAAASERRGREWRPGGEHRDPRERFKKETFQARKRREKKAVDLARGPRSEAGGAPGPRDERPVSRPAQGAFRPKGPGESGPGGGRPRPGGWNRGERRPAARKFGGAQGGFRPKGPGQSGPGGGRPRGGGWGGGRFAHPPREASRPAPRPTPRPVPRPPQPPPAVPPAAKPPEQVQKPVMPVERVAPPAKPAAPERVAPPVEPGPPAPAHKTKLPRLRKP